MSEQEPEVVEIDKSEPATEQVVIESVETEEE